MTSEAYVWIWLPGKTTPVVCGRLLETGGVIRFVYGRSYREREDSIPLDPRILPLGTEPVSARVPERLPGPIADAAPDNWGRRVIDYVTGTATRGEIDYLLAGTGERIGALHFQNSPDRYRPPPEHPATLAQLLDAAEHLESQTPLPENLRLALEHGTSIGGARPKATVQNDEGQWIAKFSTSTDRYPIVEYESATLELARRCGIDVPEHRLVRIEGKSVLLVRRFDREPQSAGTARRLLLSALTLLDLDESEAKLAGYPAFAEILRRLSHKPQEDTAALFRRMVFNILVGNTDDHAKNHACFWDGQWLELTPAYDLLPLPRVGQEGSQAMIVGDEGSRATLTNARSQAGRFGLLVEQAETIINEVRTAMADWADVFEANHVPPADIRRLDGTTVMSAVALM